MGSNIQWRWGVSQKSEILMIVIKQKVKKIKYRIEAESTHFDAIPDAWEMWLTKKSFPIYIQKVVPQLYPTPWLLRMAAWKKICYHLRIHFLHVQNPIVKIYIAGVSARSTKKNFGTTFYNFWG